MKLKEIFKTKTDIYYFNHIVYFDFLNTDFKRIYSNRFYHDCVRLVAFIKWHKHILRLK